MTGLCARACFAQLVFVPPGSATNRLRFLPVAGLLSDSPCSTEGSVRPESVSLRTRAAENYTTTAAGAKFQSRCTSS